MSVGTTFQRNTRLYKNHRAEPHREPNTLWSLARRGVLVACLALGVALLIAIARSDRNTVAVAVDSDDLAGVDLSGADLSGAFLANRILVGADLRGTDLSGANLDRANLSDANLTESNLDRTSFVGAVLDGALFDGASLDRAALRDTSIVGASFVAARMAGADMTGSVIVGSDFTDAVLGQESVGDICWFNTTWPSSFTSPIVSICERPQQIAVQRARILESVPEQGEFAALQIIDDPSEPIRDVALDAAVSLPNPRASNTTPVASTSATQPGSQPKPTSTVPAPDPVPVDPSECGVTLGDDRVAQIKWSGGNGPNGYQLSRNGLSILDLPATAGSYVGDPLPEFDTDYHFSVNALGSDGKTWCGFVNAPSIGSGSDGIAATTCQSWRLDSDQMLWRIAIHNSQPGAVLVRNGGDLVARISEPESVRTILDRSDQRNPTYELRFGDITSATIDC